jgi:hypothetical protein
MRESVRDPTGSPVSIYALTIRCRISRSRGLNSLPDNDKPLSLLYCYRGGLSNTHQWGAALRKGRALLFQLREPDFKLVRVALESIQAAALPNRPFRQLPPRLSQVVRISSGARYVCPCDSGRSWMVSPEV